MLLQTSKVVEVHKKNFQILNNPENNTLSASRFTSPSLKLGHVRSWKFIYHSPNRVEHIKTERPLEFNKLAHKLTVRKLPKLHEQIRENDPMKNSKIVENINYFREQSRIKSGLNESQVNTNQQSRVYNGQFEVSRVLVDLKTSKPPTEIRTNRSVSCTNIMLDSSRMTVVEGLKSSESLFQSMIKQQNALNQSKFDSPKKNTTNVDMAESQYFTGILGK